MHLVRQAIPVLKEQSKILDERIRNMKVPTMADKLQRMLLYSPLGVVKIPDLYDKRMELIYSMRWRYDKREHMLRSVLYSIPKNSELYETHLINNPPDKLEPTKKYTRFDYLPFTFTDSPSVMLFPIYIFPSKWKASEFDWDAHHIVVNQCEYVPGRSRGVIKTKMGWQFYRYYAEQNSTHLRDLRMHHKLYIQNHPLLDDLKYTPCHRTIWSKIYRLNPYI